MTDESSRAVSFANGYFVLADSLVPDLVDHLAEDVVLDWFGRTIEGRTNVAKFMKEEKISSRHIFNEVNPVSTIGYHKQKPLRRKYYSIGGTHENGNLVSIRNQNDEDDNDGIDAAHVARYKRKCFSDGLLSRDEGAIDADERLDNILDMEVGDGSDPEYKEQSNIYDESNENILGTSNMMECNLNFEKLTLHSDKNSTLHTGTIRSRENLDPDLLDNALSKLGNEMTSKTVSHPTNVNEVEKKIIQLRDEKIGMPLNFLDTEIGQGDGPPMHDEMNLIKYIEACGAIEFSRFFNTKQIRKDIRRRFCRLQIAYSEENKNSIRTNDKFNCQSISTNFMEIDKKNINVLKKPSKLKSLRELRQISDILIPHDGDETDFLTDDDDYDDATNERNKFLKSLNLKPMNDNEDGNMNDLVTPKYVKHHLTFDKNPKRVTAGAGDTRGFVFNYIIHLIIYESNTKCRLNLSHEFESKELSDD